MKKIFSVIIAFAAFLPAMAQKDIVVDPNAELRTVSGSFSSIKVSGGIDLFLSQSDEPAIAVSASEDRFRDGIKTVITNGQLKIYYDGDKGWSMKNRKMKVYVSCKELSKIEASGASDVRIVGSFSGDAMILVCSGASDFRGSVKLNSLKLDLSGASDVYLDGSATNVEIESSGASDVKAFDLVTETCKAEASGASDINITVNKELNAQASGASDIYFKGTGLIKEMRTSGSSTIAKKG